MAVDTDELFAARNDAERVVDCLGERLAGWALQPAVRTSLGLTPPRLPDAAGTALVLFDWDLGESEALADGFALPVAWRVSEHPDRRLPASLLRVAERVHGELKRPGRTLHLAEEAGTVDLSGLRVEADSAFTSLAASLRLASAGGRPNPCVVSTGDYASDPKGIRAVGGIPAKLRVVEDLAGSSGRPFTLFLPAENYYEALRHEVPGAAVKVVPYAAGASLEESLRPHLTLLDLEPDADSDYSQREAWLNRPGPDSQRVRRFYLERYVEDAARRVRAASRLEGVERLVLALSTVPELAVLLIRCVPAREVLLIATPEVEEHRKLVEDHAPSGVTIDVRSLKPEDERSALATDVALFLQAGRGPAVVDLTSAQRDVSAALLVAAQRARAQVVYVRTEFNLEFRRPVYGSEELLQLPWAIGGV